MSHLDEAGRRLGPRMAVDTVYSEYVCERQTLGMIVDVSEHGLRVQRLLKRSGGGRQVQLEFELPGTGEMIWARGEICFDGLWNVPIDSGGRVATLRTSGIRLVAAAGKHLKMVREYVRDLRRREPAFGLERRDRTRDAPDEPWWARAASLNA